ncbi:anaerobic ribonucleoside-triphosphate reductase activating protein [Stomatobaculum sp. F0698]|uniref:anaerobic ribonucleoside-triphosphate reductase activating protein n=1 Tax=Stomatobaculum sp. F0698 TaxID=3059030 RepID=UPI00272B1DC0|nr:anaerobic ribonucleoside-triphosphate reductase activating protein [Stomatobaculum sp. F0698]WLD87370.1 anaerobic ribonucleoside-triphosphate reductase activating protein [Stomatobaculum sp. F0698]
MNYGQVFYADTANGIGARISLFVSGCTHHCPGCFNEETWDFNFGDPFTREVEDDIIEHLRPSYIDGLSLLGGEPMEAQNQRVLLPFLERVKQEVPHATVWIYSGYTFEELLDTENRRCHTEATRRILELADILVDGKFILAEKDVKLRFRGSRNQRILELKESLKENRPVHSRYENPIKHHY